MVPLPGDFHLGVLSIGATKEKEVSADHTSRDRSSSLDYMTKTAASITAQFSEEANLSRYNNLNERRKEEAQEAQ